MGKEVLIQEADKLNVLCLHGYRQNGDSFRSKTGSLRKIIKNFANFTYISAPHFSKPINENEINENQRSWWFNKEDSSFKGTNIDGPAYKFEESLKFVEEVWNNGDFQGLIGFSQGASFVSLIASMSMKSLTSIKPRFVFLAAGFPSQSLAHKNYYEHKITIPSLHVYGLNDEIISHELSKKLQESFDNPQVHTHEGGHCLVASSKEKQCYVDFFRNQLTSYLEFKELQRESGIVADNSND